MKEALLVRRQTGAQLPMHAQCSAVSSSHEPTISCQVRLMSATENDKGHFIQQKSPKLIDVITLPEEKTYWLCEVTKNRAGESWPLEHVLYRLPSCNQHDYLSGVNTATCCFAEKSLAAFQALEKTPKTSVLISNCFSAPPRWSALIKVPTESFDWAMWLGHLKEGTNVTCRHPWGTSRLKKKKLLLFTPLGFRDSSNLLSYCLFNKKAVLTSILN